MELNDQERDEIMRLIGEGFTSGRINDGEKNIHWSLKLEVWND